MSLPAAVLWDMDGTLIDSDRLWHRAQIELAARHRVTLSSQDEHDLEGASLPRCGEILHRAGVHMQVERIAEVLTDCVEHALELRIPWTDGAFELLEQLRNAHIPCVLVTGTPLRVVRHVLHAAPDGAFGPDNRWAITGDSALPSKPASDRYLAAANMAGANIRDCLIFEDSSTGLKAAVASGGHVIAITGFTRSDVPDSRAGEYDRMVDFKGFDING